MRFLLTFLLTFSALALDNSVRLTEAAGGAQTGRPALIHRWFARGEIANYAKPRVGGSAPAAWQCDVKARWDDGSVRLAYVSWRQSFSANGVVTADFVNDVNRSSAGDDAATNAAALSQAQMVNFDAGGGAGSWNGIIEGTLNSISYTANAKTMLGAGAWRYWLRGPVVTWAIVEDKTTALSYDFGWQYSGGVWQAPSGSQYKSLHPIICVQFWPAVGAFTGWPGVEIDAILWNASTTRLQRLPLDKLRVLTGSAGSTEAYCAGTGCSVTSAGTPNFYARRTWHAVQWSGTAPGAVVTDFNLPYMVYSRVLLPYDTSLSFPQPVTDSYLATYNGMSVKPEWCNDGGGCLQWVKFVPATGGRGDISPIPAWYMYYLYAMGDGAWTVARKLDLWDKILLGNADAATSYPVHYWESDSSRSGTRAWFDDAKTVTAFGHITSVDSRLTIGLTDHEKSTDGGVNALDAMDPVCSSDPCNGSAQFTNPTYSQNWTPDQAHQGAMFFVPALLTGRPFYIWEQYFMSNWAVMGANPFRGNGNMTSLNCSYAWYGHWGSLALRGPNSDQLRQAAWMTRDMFLGAAIAGDSDPEQAYFAARLKTNDAMWEGYFNVTDGLYSPADASCSGFAWDTSTDAWCVGRKGLGVGGSNPLSIVFPGNSQPNSGNFIPGACMGFSVWQYPFLMSSFSWANQSGAVRVNGKDIFERTRREAAKFGIRKMMDADAYPFGLALYVHASLMQDGPIARYPTTHTEIASQHSFAGNLSSAITASDTVFTLTGRMSGWAYAQGWTYSVPVGILKIDNEYIFTCKQSGDPMSSATVQACPGGRGALGTTAASHNSGAQVTLTHVWYDNDHTGGYPMLAWRMFAHLTDVQSQGSSGRASWDRTNGSIAIIDSVTSANHASPQWPFAPRNDPSNVRAYGGAGVGTLYYNAPDMGACKYKIAGSLADSSDAGDANDGGGAVARKVVVTGLSAGPYRYRITCGIGRALGSIVVQ